MSDFNSLVQYTVENISRPVKYIIYKLTEFIRVVDKFIFRQVPAGAASGYANIEKVEGNTVAWNQLVKNGKFSSSQNWAAESGVTTSIGDNVINITKTSSSNIGIYQSLQAVANHIYYVTLDAKSNASTTVRFTAGGSNLRVDTLLDEGVWTHICSITTTTSNTNQIYIYQSGTPTTLSVTNVQLFDLTRIFGAGNEPTTVAEFEEWREQNGLPSVADYNAGSLISCKMESLKSIGFNQWDEEWELGAIRASNGEIIPSSNDICSKNYIKVLPNTDYYFKTPLQLAVRYYTEDKEYIGYTDKNGNSNADNNTRRTHDNCGYIKFQTAKTTYDHDICINLSDPTKNGTYQPYMTDSADIDVTTITGINTATNVRETIFPQGMKQADREGTVKDILDLRSDTATVNVGSRAYQSGDESDTDVITDGTTTYYALTTPIEYTDLQDANGNPLNPRYKVEQGGTEQVLPVNTSTPTTVAPTLTTTYTKDVH